MSIVYMVTNRSNSIIRGIVALVLGALLVLWPQNTVAIIIKIVAGFLLLVGAISLFMAIRLKSTKGVASPVISTSAIATLLFGTLIFLFPNFFVNFIAFLFGFIILLAGVGQLANLYYSSKYKELSGIYYIAPALITVCGVMLFFFPGVSSGVLTMIFGYTAMVYGVSDIVQAWKLRNVKFSKDGKYSTEVEDITYEELD